MLPSCVQCNAFSPAPPPPFRPSSKRPKSDWDADGGVEATPAAPSQWGATPGPAGGSKWDATPGPASSSGSRWDATPGPSTGAAAGARRNRWDETPKVDGGATPAWGGETPAVGADGAKKRSRWDETPAAPGGGAAAFGATPAIGGAFGATPAFTPGGAAGLETPAVLGGAVPMTPEQYHAAKVEREMEARNRPLSDEELDALLPGPEDGYKVGAGQGWAGSAGCVGSGAEAHRVASWAVGGPRG
jgi:splicing factor 3B subunit 1